MPVNTEFANAAWDVGPLTTGNVKPFDWDLLSIMLGQAGQAFSAEEPQSWQHQLGRTAAGLGQSRKFAQAATKARAGQRSQTQMLIDLLGEKPTPQGLPGLTKYEVGPKGEVKLSITPDREGFSDLFGVEPLTLGNASESMYQVNEPSLRLGSAVTAPGGAGGRSATHPFLAGLSEPSSQRRIW